MKESFTTEHHSELCRHTLEHLLDTGRVSDESGRHLKSLRRDVTDSGLDVVRNPFNEVRRVFVLYVKHLLVNFLGRHASTEHSSGSEVSTVTWVGCTHHVLSVEHLLSKLRNSKSTVLLGSSGSEGSETSNEEVKTRERNQVNSKLTKISVKLTRETEAACNPGHSSRNEVVKVSVGRGGQLKGAEADIVESFVIKSKALIRVFYELVEGQYSVVRLNNGIRDLRRWEDGEGAHHAIWVFFTDFRNEKSSHTGSSTTTKGVSKLESLQAVAGLSLLTDNVKDRVNKLCSLSVVSLSPVVTSSGLSENKVIRAEDLAEWSCTDGVHSTRLEVHKDCARNVAASSCLIVVNVNTFELKVRLSLVSTSRVDSMLVGNYFPEFGTDLVTALTSLDVNDFAHF
mmetsp:Transcript_25584/g.35718  ORF Transcript_25584/g.35718 Transcript_25584/m.35718 type:complete len:398 (-) Transcript_25584:25-1218(-)